MPVFNNLNHFPSSLRIHLAFESVSFERKDGITIVGRSQADIDNSGTIDYGEFIAETLHLNKVERGDSLFAAFQYFDKDGSGYITQDELQQACEEFGVGDIHLEEMIREIDQDNVSHLIRDGRIDYNEFVAMMHHGNAALGQKEPAT
ncbi:hypothetical protein IEQ34_010072 [Dendrobium chrysotoxum]|uniref:EF-hand domain-containing protein n=1 Tax=Dendrobium chrysotoxum TaxID=161865 RepID=A0AAV7H3S6_DENCH|nr:hypothetical protein IEQ34_010072 [Dendrobium chrysotoxum]